MQKLAFFIFTAAGLAACASGQEGLDKLHADIVADYPAVAHLPAEALTPDRRNQMLLLDIREPDEFAVSHLPGAVQIDPSISSDDLLAQLGDISDKDIVVYCSVGRRSSDFANRMQSKLIARGAVSVANLENGVFGWHDEQRELTDAEGPTDAVHPYDEIWKRYVSRKERARYTPD